MVHILFLALVSCFVFARAQDSNTGFVCALNCTFRHAYAWATVLSLNNPSNQLLTWIQGLPQTTTTVLPLKSETNDSLSKVCEVYDSYNGCLNKCPDDLFRQGVISSMSGIQMICTSQRKDFTVNTMPCIQQFTESIQQMCRDENEALLSTTNQLQNMEKTTPPVLFINILRRLCESALDQSRCVVPALQQKCGDSASDLLHQVMSALLGLVEKLIGERRDMMPVQCKELFNVIVKNDNGSIAIVLPPPTTPFMHMQADQPVVKEFPVNVSATDEVHGNCNDLNNNGAFNSFAFSILYFYSFAFFLYVQYII